MGNIVRHFEIEAGDVDRAKRFYESVFAWKISPWGPPDYYLIDTGVPAVTGDIRQSGGTTRKANCGFVCTIGVENSKAVQDAVVLNGGRIVCRNTASKGSAICSTLSIPRAIGSA